jgi:hypothetical protein
VPVRDFIQERRVVQMGPRRFIIRKPTVATLEAVLGLYAVEITKVFQACALGLPPDPLAALLPVFLAGGGSKLADVLATCCEPADEVAEAIAEHPEAAEALVMAVLSIADLPRIVGSLDFTSEERAAKLARIAEQHGVPPPESEEGPSERALAIVLLSERFHLSPMTVMDWPYEAFLTVCETLPGPGAGGKKKVDPREYAPGTIILNAVPGKPN